MSYETEAKKLVKAELKHARKRSTQRDSEQLGEAFWDNSMTLKALQRMVNDWVVKHGTDATIVFDTEEWGSGGSSPNHYIYKELPESDDQYATRMKALDEIEAKRITYHIAQLEKVAIKNQKTQKTELEQFNKLKAKLEKQGLI
jgi:hypothetical protein